MSFLSDNERMLEAIDAAVAEIRTLAGTESVRAKPLISGSWLTHFERIWEELRRQQGWPPERGPETPKTRLARRVRDSLERLLADRSTLGHAIAGGLLAQSPLFSGEGAFLAVPPELSEYETAYGFRMCTTGIDMWQPMATGHYSTELVETCLMLRLVDEISCLVDVGANVGFFSLLMANEGVDVISCEPSSANLRALRQATRASGLLERVAVLPVAMGSVEGELDLHLSALGSGGHSLAPGPGIETLEQTERVSISTLMTVWRENGERLARPLVKIDVEGFEHEVLEGAGDWLAAENAPLILVEAWPSSAGFPRDNHLRVVSLLAARGYNVHRINSKPGARSTLGPIGNPRDFEPADGGNYLALPSWGVRLEATLARPLDVRAFGAPFRLRSMQGFVTRTLESLRGVVVSPS